MTGMKLRQCAEGLIVSAVGVLFTVLSAGIRANPVAVDGAVGVLVQAKFVPLALSVLITLRGIGLTAALWRGTEKTVRDGGVTMRTLTVVLVTVAYLFLVAGVGFALPTVVYTGLLLFLVNRDRKPLFLLALTALYAFITLLLIPSLLNLRLL